MNREDDLQAWAYQELLLQQLYEELHKPIGTAVPTLKDDDNADHGEREGR